MNLVAGDIPQPAGARPVEVVGAWISTTLRVDTNTGGNPLPPAPIDNRLTPPVAVGASTSANTIDLLTSGAVGNAEGTDAGEIGWVVQVGAAPSQSGAETLLATAAETGRVSDLRRYVERIERNGQVFFRARIAGFAGRDQARETCEALKDLNMSCLAMQG